MRRRIALIGISMTLIVVGAGPAWACGGLVAPNGAVSLLRTITLAGYHNGVEHYVTSFEFAGGGGEGGEVGSIIPLPGVPTRVERGGEWTLQRLILETQPQPQAAFLVAADEAGAAERAEVLLETKIDALEITILKGGGTAVGNWAREHGFALTPDAPEVLDFYAERSPIFMAARFDAREARERGFSTGDGTPIHLTIPTPNPWVPLRILALGQTPEARVEADVYLLTDREPTTLPVAIPAVSADLLPSGLILERSEQASDSLIADLRSDKGMGWIPSSGMWLTYLRVDSKAGDLGYDLAIDASGAGSPSRVQAGLDPVGGDEAPRARIGALIAAAGVLVLVLVVATRAQRGRSPRPAV